MPSAHLKTLKLSEEAIGVLKEISRITGKRMYQVADDLLNREIRRLVKLKVRGKRK